MATVKQRSGHGEPGEPSCVLVSLQINESFANLTWQPIRDMFRFTIVFKDWLLLMQYFIARAGGGWNSKKTTLHK